MCINNFVRTFRKQHVSPFHMKTVHLIKNEGPLQVGDGRTGYFQGQWLRLDSILFSAKPATQDVKSITAKASVCVCLLNQELFLATIT